MTLSTIGALALVAAVLFAFPLARGLKTRAKLKQLKRERSEAEAVARCVGEFPAIDPNRTRAAYRWVQELVAIEKLPLYPDDHLIGTLHLDQGDIDDKLEASYECYGPEKNVDSSNEPIATVSQLMAVVISAGYESYPRKEADEHAT